jgi:quercetin dioxygenase-like cupin family protein
VEIEIRRTVVEVHVPPGGRSPDEAHPGQEVRFQVVRGTLGFRLGGRELSLTEGERVTVPAGVGHAFWNEGAEPALFVAETREVSGEPR